ncbi:hypothetical protein, partial [Helicobacter suis]|uniref:hypothetical protein n=1 Tax=Helicobacter suis TaxID=104628 RepID=UPI001C5B9FAD
MGCGGGGLTEVIKYNRFIKKQILKSQNNANSSKNFQTDQRGRKRCFSKRKIREQPRAIFSSWVASIKTPCLHWIQLSR